MKINNYQSQFQILIETERGNFLFDKNEQLFLPILNIKKQQIIKNKNYKYYFYPNILKSKLYPVNEKNFTKINSKKKYDLNNYQNTKIEKLNVEKSSLRINNNFVNIKELEKDKDFRINRIKELNSELSK